VTNEECIKKVKAARNLLAEVVEDCGIPMIEGAISEADLNLHWVLWNMGEPVELHPELEKV
jgi:hypothetical protein